MPGLTLDERYYHINKNLNEFLQSKYVDCPIYKYGIDVATLKSRERKSEGIYPYAQTVITNISSNAWTSEESGHLTKFDYILNYFTSPRTEFERDDELFKPFEFIKLAFTDINKTVLQLVNEETLDITMLADIHSLSFMPGYVVKGAVTPSRILIVKMMAVCGYPASIGGNGLATDTSKAMEFEIIP